MKFPRYIALIFININVAPFGATLNADAATTFQAELDRKLPGIIAEAKSLAANPTIVGAVRDHNQHPPKLMSPEEWRKLSVRDPIVASLRTNAAAELIKAQIQPYISEAFLSGNDGTKVAFLNKTTNWSHSGKPKHDEPMAGRDWQGKLELDESSGVQQIQISVPVWDGKAAIGSLVFGIAAAKL